jgi:hypothetical protein
MDSDDYYTPGYITAYAAEMTKTECDVGSNTFHDEVEIQFDGSFRKVPALHDKDHPMTSGYLGHLLAMNATALERSLGDHTVTTL